MSIAQTTQNFVGISNENEFYGHHYLAEVFKGDIRALIEAWQSSEDAALMPQEASAIEGSEGNKFRSPYKKLAGLGGKWFAALSSFGRTRDDVELLQNHVALHSPLFEALGYILELQGGMPVPIWAAYGKAHQAPQLLIVPAYQPGREEEDTLDHKLSPSQYGGQEVPTELKKLTWLEIVSEAFFGVDQPPRYIILVGFKEWLLLDRYKWPNNRLLRFDWTEILDRKETYTLQAAAALLHHDSLAPNEGASLLDGLDENAHKHAFGVSEDLKYALREAIELLGNEAIQQLRKKAQEGKQGFYSGKDAVDAGDLSLECLRLVYRLLFLFYIEARPELGYVPIQKSETYAKGYSLESLRDLELTPLNTSAAQEGMYFDATLRKLFTLIADGCGTADQPSLVAGSVKDAFVLAPLDSKLFDPTSTPLLNQVRFPNHIWQSVIRLMSLSGGRHKGRVSYQLLSINQLGAVYEALLSYKGFFAKEDLYEVQPEPRGVATTSDDDEVGDDESEGGSTDVMDSAWFVPASRIHEYKLSERVHSIDEQGRKTLKKYPRDTFIYRLAGRDRQKSASYYTPQVLTRCIVKYALKELLVNKTANEILTLTVVEPAMGSAAFLNEAVNQLAEAYLERKQAELKRRIPHEQYATELQKTRMYIADRNVFGVDLNPIATELAEVSLWLNAIYGEVSTSVDLPRTARVPWFGYQLFAGNSLIGARREVFSTSQLLKSAKPIWYEAAPHRIDPQCPNRKADEIYHFLLPDPGMANYTDKVAKQLYADDFARLKSWRNELLKPLQAHEIKRLLQLSDAIDVLWAAHSKQLSEDRVNTEDSLAPWPSDSPLGPIIPRALKEAIRTKGLLNRDDDFATPYRRLKLVMDYWCALWFWPINKSNELPSREQWWMEIGAILEGNVVDLALQTQIDFTVTSESQQLMPEVQDTLFGLVQPMLSTAVDEPNLHDKYGQLRFSKLRQNFPRIESIEAIAKKRLFMHWDLTFADIFIKKGGFDLVVGNPPWLKVQWSEKGILGEINPLVAIRKLSSTELAQQRSTAFIQFPSSRIDWTNELEESEATQNFLRSYVNYPLLKGVQTNLYKCFMPLGWTLANINGIVGYLQPEGPYDDPNGGHLRSEMYSRLKSHFQFLNEMKLFDIGNRKKFGINIFSSQKSTPIFDFIANLFVPSTVDLCYAHDGSGDVAGIKTSDGIWSISGHSNRLIEIDLEKLKIFAALYDDPNTPPLYARLPSIHAKIVSKTLEKLATYPERIGDRKDDLFLTSHWNQKSAQDNLTIFRNIERVATFPENTEGLVFSGSHIYVLNPLYKTPKRLSNNPKAFEVLNLTSLPDSYLPRTVYTPMADVAEYRRRTPNARWGSDEVEVDVADDPVNPSIEDKVTNYPRLAFRAMLDTSSERTLAGCIIPPGPAHINGVQSTAFKTTDLLLSCASVTSSLIGDFFIKSTGRSNLYGTWMRLPLIQNTVEISSRILALNCLTAHYSQLWADTFSPEFRLQKWSQEDSTRIDSKFFSQLTSKWGRSCALRGDYIRRLALIEIDVLVAESIGISLDELISIYKIQFPVIQQNEKDTWYDSSGSVIFTNNVGISGVGLARATSRSNPEVTLTYANGDVEIGRFGWEYIYALQDNGKLLPGSTVAYAVVDDTLQEGPCQRSHIFTAPFITANREVDYRIAWDFFESQKSDIKH
jgi:hypothetical protein